MGVVSLQLERGVICLLLAVSSRMGIALTSVTGQQFSSHHHSHLALVGGGDASLVHDHHHTATATATATHVNATTRTRFASTSTRLFAEPANSGSPAEEMEDAMITSAEQLNEQLKAIEQDKKGPLKVLFLSADTGGGHRASAEALAAQFLIHFPGSTYDLFDCWTEFGVYPYKTLVKTYTHLSAHPRQWRLLYYMSNWRYYMSLVLWHSTVMCERKIRRKMAQYDPDVVVSVHPTMNGAPLIATKKISKALGKHIPFFTVVTDLGSGHISWFSKHVEKLYIASEQIQKLAKRKMGTPEDILVMSGLPIRHSFAEEAEKLQDRTTEEGKAYQLQVRKNLAMATIKDPSKPMVLVMGGGEGVGKLSAIVDGLYASFVRQGVDATICVVCGRNEKLKNGLETRDWDHVVKQFGDDTKRRRGLRRLLHLGRKNKNKKIRDAMDHAVENEQKAHEPGKVDVIGLGYVTNMAEFMVAADILVTKAGPGTIAEAASVGLPCMLTSFLPGQEAGNVDVVLESGFGDYCDDPVQIGQEVSAWLQEPTLMNEMSLNAMKTGHPNAAAEIVLDIGTITNTWKTLNGEAQQNSARSLKI